MRRQNGCTGGVTLVLVEVLANGVGVGGIYVKGDMVPRQREPELRQSRGGTGCVG